MISGKKIENSYPFYLVSFPAQGITQPEWRSASVLTRQGYKYEIDVWNEKEAGDEKKEEAKATPTKRRKTLEKKPAELLDITPIHDHDLRPRKSTPGSKSKTSAVSASSPSSSANASAPAGLNSAFFL